MNTMVSPDSFTFVTCAQCERAEWRLRWTVLGSEHSSLIESVSDCLVRNVRLSKLPGVNKNAPMHKTGPAAGLMTFFNPIQLIITAQCKCPHHRFMDIEGHYTHPWHQQCQPNNIAERATWHFVHFDVKFIIKVGNSPLLACLVKTGCCSYTNCTRKKCTYVLLKFTHSSKCNDVNYKVTEKQQVWEKQPCFPFVHSLRQKPIRCSSERVGPVSSWL